MRDRLTLAELSRPCKGLTPRAGFGIQPARCPIRCNHIWTEFFDRLQSQYEQVQRVHSRWSVFLPITLSILALMQHDLRSQSLNRVAAER